MKTIFGIAGEIGSFSEEAAFLYVKRFGINPDFRYLIDMEGVLHALYINEINLGILPVVNLQGGLVKPAFAAMGKYAFKFIDDFWLNIKQCLLVQHETTFNQITRVVSHPQALAQCKNYLHENFKEIELIEWSDTAIAARDLSISTLPKSTAVIAPERCAQIYGLKLMAKNIQDSNPNLTAFIVVKPA